MKKLAKILGVSVLSAMLLAGCGTDNQDVPPPENTPDTGVEPGTEDPGLGTDGSGTGTTEFDTGNEDGMGTGTQDPNITGEDGTGENGMNGQNGTNGGDELPGQDDQADDEENR